MKEKRAADRRRERLAEERARRGARERERQTDRERDEQRRVREAEQERERENWTERKGQTGRERKIGVVVGGGREREREIEGRRRWKVAWPGMTLLAPGQRSTSPTVQTRPSKESAVGAPHCPSGARNLAGSLHSVSRARITSADAAMGSCRMAIGIVPA